MRLKCPNCAAQYEVPDQVIPEEGRDVQCSSCGTTWFQRPPDAVTEPPASAVSDRDRIAAEPSAPKPASEPEPAAEPEPDRAPAEPVPEPTPQPGARPRALDPEVADVLRQEAALEARRRAAEAQGLESQPELGLDGPQDDPTERRRRENRPRRAPQETAPASSAAPPAHEPEKASETEAINPSSRRDLLPDVEEINQTLRSSGERRAVETPQGRAAVLEQEDEGSGFGRGFAIVVLLVAIAIAVYAFESDIAAWIPAIAEPLAAYADWVDGIRIWLDAQAGQFLETLSASGEDTSAGD